MQLSSSNIDFALTFVRISLFLYYIGGLISHLSKFVQSCILSARKYIFLFIETYYSLFFHSVQFSRLTVEKFSPMFCNLLDGSYCWWKMSLKHPVLRVRVSHRFLGLFPLEGLIFQKWHQISINFLST